MQIAILCNFVTLTINFIRMPISDILFLRFSAYFTKKRTAPPPHAEGRRIRRHEFLCMITISKNTPRRAVTKMQLWIYCTPPPGLSGGFLYTKKLPPQKRREICFFCMFLYIHPRALWRRLGRLQQRPVKSGYVFLGGVLRVAGAAGVVHGRLCEEVYVLLLHYTLEIFGYANVL